MLSDILSTTYQKPTLLELYKNPCVSYCLFRSLSCFQKSIIMRFITASMESIMSNNNYMACLKQQQLRNQLKKEAWLLLKETLQLLESLSILEYTKSDGLYSIAKAFVVGFEKGLNLAQQDQNDGQQLFKDLKKSKQQPLNQQYELLHLLQGKNLFLKYCELISLTEGRMTKNNLNYMRSSVSQKIGLLIKGYLKFQLEKKNEKHIIKDILMMSLKDPKRYYAIEKAKRSFVMDLASLKLIKVYDSKSQVFVNGQIEGAASKEADSYCISPFLHGFAFKEQGRSEQSRLGVRVIIETNLKVYTQVKVKSHYKIIRAILSQLVQIEHEDYTYEGMIVGKIVREKMKKLFQANITSEQYFDFFLRYMRKSKNDTNTNKDLGKWNKIAFLGLEGPGEQSLIPNNVKQEVRLWQQLRNHDVLYEEQINVASDVQ